MIIAYQASQQQTLATIIASLQFLILSNLKKVKLFRISMATYYMALGINREIFKGLD